MNWTVAKAVIIGVCLTGLSLLSSGCPVRGDKSSKQRAKGVTMSPIPAIPPIAPITSIPTKPSKQESSPSLAIPPAKSN